MLKLIHVNKEHEKLTELLPWYVNGTLPQIEYDAVEKHVSNCETCQQDINLIKNTFQATNNFDASVIPSDDNFNRIMQRIERTDIGQSDTDLVNNDGPLINKSWYQKPYLALAASFLGAMLLFYGVNNLFISDTGDYQVLTSGDTDQIELEIFFNTDVKPSVAEQIIITADSRFQLQGTHPNYRIELPSDYDVIKINDLISRLNTEKPVSNVRIVRE